MMPRPPAVIGILSSTPIWCLFDGFAAVLLFFVLSGFVLNLKYVEHPVAGRSWVWPFLIRRIFRIYPAFLVTISIALILKAILFDQTNSPPFSKWFLSFWRTPVTIPEVLRTALLISPNINSDLINPPMWSLVIEMRVSLFFPVIIFILSGKMSLVRDTVILLATCGLYLIFSGANTFFYLPHFVLGALCAKYALPLREWAARLPGGKRALWIASSLILYETLTIMEKIFHPEWRLPLKYLAQLMSGVGAAGLIVSCISYKGFCSLLCSGPFQFLGRISYSFYLIHLICLFSVAPFVFRLTNSFVLTWLSAFVTACLTSNLLFAFVEAPAIEAGNRLISALRAR